MKHIAAILLLLLATVPLGAQRFIGCRTDGGWAETPMLRTTFKLKASDFATTRPGDTIAFSISVASLGYHEVYVNGRMVGDMVLQPAVSQLDKQALMVNYDITDLVSILNSQFSIPRDVWHPSGGPRRGGADGEFSG